MQTWWLYMLGNKGMYFAIDKLQVWDLIYTVVECLSVSIIPL